MADVPLQVISENSSSERRITPSWTISELKVKLEPITGIPPSSQILFLKVAPSSLDQIAISSPDEESTTLFAFNLVPYAELHVRDSRPPSARPNYTDTSGIEKYVLPDEEYEKKSDSVLAWKKAQKLGRFDPTAPMQAAAKRAALETDIKERGVFAGRRCRVGTDDGRRGLIMYVGEVPEIPGGSIWVGVRLDEPVGKNDGSIGGKRYWDPQGEAPAMNHGIFVHPERVEAGEWPPIEDLDDMEEI